MCYWWGYLCLLGSKSKAVVFLTDEHQGHRRALYNKQDVDGKEFFELSIWPVDVCESEGNKK